MIFDESFQIRPPDIASQYFGQSLQPPSCWTSQRDDISHARGTNRTGKTPSSRSNASTGLGRKARRDFRPQLGDPGYRRQSARELLADSHHSAERCCCSMTRLELPCHDVSKFPGPLGAASTPLLSVPPFIAGARKRLKADQPAGLQLLV